MKTSPERFIERHKRIIERCELEFLDKRKTNRRYTISKAIRDRARLVYHSIRKRDDIASVHAIAAAHLAMKMPLD